MLRLQWAAAAAIALTCTACSKQEAKAPPPPAEAPSTPAVAEVPAPVPATPEPAASVTPTPPPVEPTASAIITPAAQRVVRVVPARERRIHALLNNAISRDVTGETEHDAGMWEARRAACKTQACVDRAYAAQETELRKWEGSEDIH